MVYWLLKGLAWPVLHLLFRVRTEGRELVPRRGPVILAANHQSFCDSLFLPLVVPRRVTYLAKAEYFDDRRTAWFFRSVGQIPIRREGGDASERALATAAEVLTGGELLALYPEGTRSLDPAVHRGHTGVARLAAHCRVPVVPVGIGGTVEVQPVGSRTLRPFRRVDVHFGPPLPPPASEDPAVLRRFTDELMHRVAGLSGRPYVDRYIVRGTADPEISLGDGLAEAGPENVTP